MVPDEPGVWPVTFTPVRMSMPRFWKARCTGRTTSVSTPGRMPGSASSTVTWLPRSQNIDANSQPMAPPPMTATREGKACSSNTSSEVRTTLPSTSNPGMRRGTEPAASTMWVPVSSRVAPSPPVTVTTLPGPSRPVPVMTSTLRFFSRPLRPLTSLSTTCCLRLIMAGTSRPGASARTPNSLAPATVRNTEAVSSSSLAGMQPRLRQVPPTRPFSTMAMRRPAAAP